MLRKRMQYAPLRLARDCTSFFAALPTDVRELLVQFIRWRASAPGPATLQFSEEVMQGEHQSVWAVCFDYEDRAVVPIRSHNEVRVYDAGGRVGTIGVSTRHAGPTACVVSSDGRLFVAEYDALCVHVFRADGQFERAIGAGQIEWPHGLDLSRDEAVLYVAAIGKDVVKAYSAESGAFLRDIGAGLVYRPASVAVLSTGRIAVCCSSRVGNVLVFSADDTLALSLFTTSLLYPWQIAADQDDRLYVANRDAHEIMVFSSADGHFVGRFGSYGTDNGQFNYPMGVAIDSADRVMVADIWGRVQLFTLP